MKDRLGFACFTEGNPAPRTGCPLARPILHRSQGGLQNFHQKKLSDARVSSLESRHPGAAKHSVARAARSCAQAPASTHGNRATFATAKKVTVW